MNVETTIGLVLDMASGGGAPTPASAPAPDLLNFGASSGAAASARNDEWETPPLEALMGPGGGGSGKGAGADDELWETPPLEAMTPAASFRRRVRCSRG